MSIHPTTLGPNETLRTLDNSVEIDLANEYRTTSAYIVVGDKVIHNHVKGTYRKA